MLRASAQKVDIQPVTGATEHTPPSNRAFFSALDGVRALAFLMVFFSHYVKWWPGSFGVDIFFVLSGFLITGILYDTRNAENRFRNFYVRRSLRIFPLYYAVLLVIVLAWPVYHWQWDWRWLSWPFYVGNWVLFVHRGAIDDSTLMLVNGWLHGKHSGFVLIGHFWSLCVEEQFYLVWPWVVFKVKGRRALIAICTAVVVLCPLLRFVAFETMRTQRITDGILVHGTPFRMDTLMFGSLIALLYRGDGRDALLRGARWCFWIAAGILAIAQAVSLLRPEIFGDLTFPVYTWGFSVIAFFSALLILNTLGKDRLVFRIFSNPVLRWLGRITYGSYIFHDIAHPWYTRMAVLLHVPEGALALAATILISWLSFKYFESPLLDLKDRFAPASPHRDSGAKVQPRVA